MIVVPYDIWLHITSYLCAKDIWDLRSLNCALLDIALDSRYRTVEVSVDFRESKSYICKFLRFRDPNIAKRVRHLSYENRADTPFPPRRPAKTTLGSIKRHFQKLLTNFLTKPFLNDADMVNTMESFTNLVSLELQCGQFFVDSPDSYPECVPLIHTNFRVCYSQLQDLIFAFPLDLFSVIILPDLCLPSLTSLSMMLFGSTDQTPFEDVAATGIAPFINRHRHTLTSISFEMKAGENENIDMGLLVEGLDQITSLKNIFMCISSPTRDAVIARFFETHQKTLEVITIGLMARPYQRVDNILQDVSGELPNLQKFSVLCSGFHCTPPSDTNLGPTLDFIKRCSSSLVSFTIRGAPQALARFYDFLDFRGRQDAPFMNLMSLNMGLQVLTPDMMDLLASRLPNLS